MVSDEPTLAPGRRVRITQQFPRYTGSLTTVVEGVVLSVGQQKTGSWFAHGKDGRLWLDRVELRKDDGEVVFCNLDQYSHIDVIA